MLLVVLAVWAFWVEPRRLLVRETAVSIPHWSAAREPLRIAVLADLHVGSPHHGIGKLRQIVARVNAAEPDIILILGDLVIQGVIGGRFVAPETVAVELTKLRAPLGRFAVLGNHDWWLDAPRVAAALGRSDIMVLDDSSHAVGIGADEFWLAGVSDLWEGRHDIAGALRSVPDGAPVIVFTHNPDIFPDVPARVALTIGGHTHGGQVNLPFIGRPIVPSRFGERYAAGHIVQEGRHLFVSTGTGTSILPVRFRVPPEITVLELRSADAVEHGAAIAYDL